MKRILILLFFLISNLAQSQVQIIPRLFFTSKNVTSGAQNWVAINAAINNATTDYYKMLNGSSLTSTSMDFSNFSSINVKLSLQSFGTIVSNSDKVRLEIYDGVTWTQVGPLLTTSSTNSNPTISLPYTYIDAKLRITTPNATSSSGARVFSVEITGYQLPSSPQILSIIYQPSDSSALVDFIPPSAPGSGTITNYEYKINLNPWIALSPASTSSPLMIPDVNGYQTFFIRALSQYGGGKSSPTFITPVPLPVELLYFKGSENNFLIWETASEKNNEGFEIQKSLDMVNWEVDGFVKGSGTTSITTSYSYLTNDNRSLYYRLKQIDFDGSFSYSKVIFMMKNSTKEKYNYFDIHGREQGEYYIKDGKKYKIIK
jgi:hypothetical protein